MAVSSDVKRCFLFKNSVDFLFFWNRFVRSLFIACFFILVPTASHGVTHTMRMGCPGPNSDPLAAGIPTFGFQRFSLRQGDRVVVTFVKANCRLILTKPPNADGTYPISQSSIFLPGGGSDAQHSIPMTSAADLTLTYVVMEDLREDYFYVFVVGQGPIRPIGGRPGAAASARKAKDPLPIAEAGPSQILLSQSPPVTVNLNGTGSTASHPRTIENYQWTNLDGIALTGRNTATPSFTAPTVAAGDPDKVLTFTLTVTDDNKNISVADTVTVTITGKNKAPTANAGLDKEVDLQAEVMLDGSASIAPETNQTLSYAWAGPSGITLTGGDTASPSFTAPTITTGNADQVLDFSLIVTDNLGLSSPVDTVSITVKAAENAAPIANAGADDTVKSAAENVTLDGTASSAPEDDQTLSYAWTGPSGITLTGGNTATPSFTAPTLATNADDQVLEFSLVVSDNLGLVSPADTVSITVTAADNITPIANAGADREVISGAGEIILDGTASRAPEDDQTLSYAWTGPSDVILTGADTATPSFIAPTLATNAADQILEFSLVVTDSLGLSSPADKVLITMTDADNLIPIADAGADRVVASGASNIILDGTGSTAPEEEQTLSYAWTGPADLILTGADTATPSFTAPTLGPQDRDRILTFSLIVTDNLGASSEVDRVAITVALAPTVTLSDAPQAFRNHDDFTILAAFSEPVKGFDNRTHDVEVDYGMVEKISGGPVVYTLTITPTGGGDVLVNIPAGAAQDEDDHSNLRSNSIVVADQVAEVTQAKITHYMATRARSLATNQPDLTCFLAGGCPQRFDGEGSNNSGQVDSHLFKGNVWGSLTASWSDESSYVLGSIGAHINLTPKVMVGGMVQFDRAKDEAHSVSGKGWLAGPYFVLQPFEQPFYIEGRFLYGQSRNEITPIGTYTDEFETERFLAQLGVSGTYQWKSLSLKPLLGVTYTTDTQKAYTDSVGHSIVEQKYSLLQAKGGLEFSVPIPVPKGVLTLRGGVSGFYTSHKGVKSITDFEPLDSEDWRGRVHMGLTYDLSERVNFNVTTFYDGIGVEHRERGVTFGFKINF